MRTDLAKEAREACPDIGGVMEQTEREGDFALTRITVSSQEAAEKLDKPIGIYSAITMPKETLFDRAMQHRCAAFAAKELMALLPEEGELLIVGLGNRYITADALGTKTAENVLVTRHLGSVTGDLLPHGTRSVASFCTGVLGVTGIETVEVVSALTERLRPAALVVIDSLAASRREHLGTVIQMNDTGISPGAGVGNFQTSLNRETLGVPVIALGIPLVIGTQTLIGEGKGEEVDAFADFSVTPKDVDLLVKNGAKLLCELLNRAIHVQNYPILQNLLQ